jgi:hypothetical protein
MNHEIVKKISYAVKCGADVSMRLNDPEWCELVFATLSERIGEDVESVQIGAIAARKRVPFEVVRLYLYLNDIVSIPPIRDALRLALEPFIVGGRQLIVHDIPEGFEIVLDNQRKAHVIHDESSSAEGVFPSAYVVLSVF